MKDKHQKHTNLKKPFLGKYHSNEWELIGSSCDYIETLASRIAAELKELKIGYLDSDHKSEERRNCFFTVVKENIGHINTKVYSELNQYQLRKNLSDLDLVLINGNHFYGQNQIVIIEDNRVSKLEKKKDKLVNIKLVILQHEKQVIPEFILERVEQNEEVQFININDISGICNVINTHYEQSIPKLHGLVLSGGKSSRMGSDKGSLVYHTKEQREYEADVLDQFCEKTFISCKKDQNIESKYEFIYDSFEGLGPFGGIISAFRQHPDCAILSLACDLPHLTKEDVNQLVKNRNTSKLATCFFNPQTNFPEPLITIWEPRAYPVLLDFLSQGYSCPRKVLINSDIQLLSINDEKSLFNVNNIVEYEEARNDLK
jgi:molybdopterin-guanine dinucleotide biosynthesis protein A